MKLAIITTHPIQYNAPLFKLLNEQESLIVKVFYTWGVNVLNNKFDPGFNKTIEWDIPLLEGYDYTFSKNIASVPGSHHFKGIDNPALIEEIESWQAEAVLVFGWSFKSHLNCIRYFHNKVPVYFRGDSTLTDATNFVKNFARKFFLRWVYSFVNGAFYVGTENKHYYTEYGLKENQLFFAPHAVDNIRFNSYNTSLKKNQTWRNDLGIAEDEMIFLYAGKLEPKKNIAFLVKCFYELNLRSAHLVIAGNGVLEESLKLLCREYPSIHFVDFQNQSQMPGVYDMADIFVLPSIGPGETWGLSVNEAMASGKAILVSSKAGCAIDLVKPGINGFIFSPHNPGELKQQLKMLNNKYKVAEMGDQSLVIINGWTLQKAVTEISSVLAKAKIKELL
ncbi:hypothetical protein BH11BAC3_BH11BAC3_39530 [soil metagenome]